MMTSSKHILLFAEAVTLAHVARCVALANALADHNYRVTLATDSRYNALLGEINFTRIPLHSVSSEYFSKQLAQGLPLYTSKILTAYVKEDLQIIEQVKPDFIVGDFRLSLGISSRLAKVPYATITNAYWSPYAAIDYPIPELPLTKIFGVSLAQKLFDLVRPLVFKIHSLAFNKTCKHFGLPPLAYDMREIYTHADYTLYADIEGIIPMKPLPDNHVLIGPVLWSADVPLPDWWESVPIDKPIIFVTLGSSGDSRLLPMIISTLAKMPVTVICITAKRSVLIQTDQNVFIAEFLPAEAAVMKADIVICNGGSPMVYQSLIENKVIIGIPNNLDQYLMMSALHKAGKGIMVRAGKANPQSIHAAIDQSLELLKNPILVAYGDSRLAIEKITALIDAA